MIDVAIVSMEEALRADGETLPAGAGALPRDVMQLPKPGEVSARRAGLPEAEVAAPVSIDPPLPGV
jgi:hypothetical protein